ncbi:type VII secretion target [Actinophytocola xanthii]|uniref:ESX-1 secretion-associated protein n=1 Tax=Actinophytocola xanthii TaxID=1912961 RepID=A0A1Q8CRQ0_9PSEU|nr:type VII secretion target [Actinophytocola xanthii]OLF17042.1 hypothetical protein BU204_13150 [Actinophytocola xanthii]
MAIDGFAVVPADLRAAADDLSRLGGELDQNVALRYSMNPREIGHPELEPRIEEFQRLVAAAVTSLRDDALEAGERLRLTAACYEETDEARATDIRASLPTDPR